MKVLLFAILSLGFASAHAVEPTAKDMADLLIDTKVGQCVTTLKAQTSSYMAIAEDVKVVESKAKSKNRTRVTTLSYGLIEGGDIMAGTAQIVIVEKFAAQFGFPESAANINYVDSCSVKVDAQ
jgi:hypothetical protein